MKLQDYYDVFVRDWWLPNPAWSEGKELGPGPKKYLARHVTWKDARAMCDEYNDGHERGKYARMAELESVRMANWAKAELRRRKSEKTIGE